MRIPPPPFPIAHMTTTVVNIRRHEFDVYVGRAGHGFDGYFGNPIKRRGPSGSTIDAYRDHFYERLETDEAFKQRVLALRGKRLGCFCVQTTWSLKDNGPPICHAQVIAHYLDKLSLGEHHDA